MSAPLREQFARTHRLTREALQNLRAIILDLRPAALDDLGLVPAIRRYAAHHLEPLGIEFATDTQRWPKARLGTTVETVLFRILQESINNVARHAHARHVRIWLSADNEGISARIEDDGEGFDPSAPRDGLGLVGMRERVSLIGGRVEVHSAPGAGTQIEIGIPLQRAKDDEQNPRATGR